MFKIFRTADTNGILKLNILSNEEITEIKNKQIICFKFPPTISINITKELQDYYFNNYFISVCFIFGHLCMYSIILSLFSKR